MAVSCRLERRSEAADDAVCDEEPALDPPPSLPFFSAFASSGAAALASAASSSASSASICQAVLPPVIEAQALRTRLAAVSLLGASTERQNQRTKRLGCPAGPV